MGYRRALLTRWSRRDKLAILVIAVTVGFLTGTTIVVAAVSTQTTSIAAEYGTDGTAVHYDSVARAQEEAGTDALVVPMATVELPNGETRYVAGISKQQASAFKTDSDASIPAPPPSGVTSGTRTTKGKQRLVGDRGPLTVAVTPRTSGEQLIPSDWYVAQPDTIRKLGASGAYVITPAGSGSGAADGAGIPSRGVTLRSALAFFVTGTRQLLTVLTLTAVGGTVLVGVTIYSVMKMTVRDRRQSIRVLRSTGCRPRTVLSLFALRAGLLTAIGVGVGYALGIILPNIAVNAAVSLGLPTSLSVHVSRLVLTVLIPLYVGTLFVALMAGAAAVWPTVSPPPARVTGELERDQPREAPQSRLRRLFTLQLLDWRALAPSMATLTVFVTVILLMGSIAGVMTPLMSAQGTTLTEPGAIHPVASDVPQQYANALRAKGIAASAEILLFTVRDGQPVVARGVNYSSFASVSNATLERGRPPQSANEAVVGADLARTAGIDVGDNVSLGGSTETGLARVRIVGTYTAPGVYDDQILVSLPVGRQLSTKSNGSVHIVRTPKRLEGRPDASVERLDVSAPPQVESNERLPVTIRLRNFRDEPVTHNVTATLGDASKTVSIRLDSGSQRAVTVKLPTPEPGTATLRVGNETRSITVVSPNAIQIRGLPETAPPNSTPHVRVSTMAGAPVKNASIRVSTSGNGSDTMVRTDENGSVGIPFGAAGNSTVRVTAGNRTITRTVRVSQSTFRTLVADIGVRPSSPSLLSRTSARLQLFNPWNRTLDRDLRLSGGGADVRQTVSVAPGDTVVKTVRLGQQTPGSHSLSLVSDGQPIASTSYTVSGDDRLVTAYAGGGSGAGGTGIGRALTTAFGNLQLLLVVLVSLAGLMTVGSTTAVFAQAVHARQRAIGVYRATGAWPTRVLRLVVGDALRIGVVAVGGALVFGTGALFVLDRLNYLVVYGVRISTTLTPGIVIGSVLGGLAIMLLSAGLVAVQFSRRQPAKLVKDSVGATERGRPSDGRGVQ
ncbi:hypothetical protein BG842_03230 [Haladaptatus sp. W1]|uniref:FtsX-like permease family protein n=1 Tax=Haladaptatus sp. W1 TaxID=1897478 RepID=UPI0008498535|nr:ABC transporter permease [Haladaptatus sp. W1]ODR79821.1 hypothetical protein BG842_03230 [Haladaptatus sp. W1]